MPENNQEKNNQENKKYGIALLSLESMGPARLEKLSTIGSFKEIWECLLYKNQREIASLTELKIDLVDKWKRQAQDVDPDHLYEQHLDLEILIKGEPDYPQKLNSDIDSPAVLFAKGSFKLNEVIENQPVVSIVGTRNCSRYGVDIASELGRELANEGVVVVSGLAYGIDYAAHHGSTEAFQKDPTASPSIGIIASGLDIVYPKRNLNLYQKVLKCGAIVSETPLGFPPQKWKFPARNRIIAGLSDLVIVVESHLKGGSLSTAEEAGVRGKVVMAVPGSIRSPTSAGTNALIADGCQPFTDISDVFTALDLTTRNTYSLPNSSNEIKSKISELNKSEKLLLDVFSWEVKSLENLLQNTEMEFFELSIILEGLTQKGLVVKRGLNFERVST